MATVQYNTRDADSLEGQAWEGKSLWSLHPTRTCTQGLHIFMMPIGRPRRLVRHGVWELEDIVKLSD